MDITKVRCLVIGTLPPNFRLTGCCERCQFLDGVWDGTFQCAKYGQIESKDMNLNSEYMVCDSFLLSDIYKDKEKI